MINNRFEMAFELEKEWHDSKALNVRIFKLSQIGAMALCAQILEQAIEREDDAGVGLKNSG